MTFLPPRPRRRAAFDRIAGWAVYLGLGLVFHLVFYGAPDWAGLWVYVVLLFWPVVLLFKALWLALMLGAAFLLGFVGYRLYARWRNGAGD